MERELLEKLINNEKDWRRHNTSALITIEKKLDESINESSKRIRKIENIQSKHSITLTGLIAGVAIWLKSQFGGH